MVTYLIKWLFFDNSIYISYYMSALDKSNIVYRKIISCKNDFFNYSNLDYPNFYML